MTTAEAAPDPEPFGLPRRSVARNAAALFVSQTFTWVLATVVTTVQPRFLGPIGQGQLRLATSLWTIIILLAAFGTGTMMTVEVAKDPRTADSLLKRSLRIRAVAFVAVLPLVGLFLWFGGYDRQTVRIALLMGISTVFALVTTALTGAMFGLREMGKTARVDVINKLAFTVGVIGVLVAGGGVTGIAATGIAFTIFGLYQIWHVYPSSLPPGQYDSPLKGRLLLRISGAFLLADATLVIYQQIDTIVISQLVGPEAIGWYATADTLFGSLLFIPVVLTTALFPAMAESYHRAPHEAEALLIRTFRSLVLLAVPVGIGTIVVAKSFVGLLYGSKFKQTGPVLQIYGVVAIFEFIIILLGRYAQSTGRIRFWTSVMVVAIVASVPLDIVLVPWTERTFHNGAMGGALSYVATEGFILVAALWKIAPGLINRSTVLRMLRCLVGAGAMLAVGWPLREKFFLIPGMLSFAAYALVLWVTRTFDESEREQFKKAAHTARRRLPFGNTSTLTTEVDHERKSFDE